MKNTIRLLLILGVIMILFIGAFLTFKLTFYNKVLGDCVTLDIEFENEDAFASMLDWAEREDVNIVKLDESQDGYKAVHVSSKLLKEIDSERIAMSPFRTIPVDELTEAEHWGYSSLYFVSLTSDEEINAMEAALVDKGIKVEKRIFCTPFSLLLSDRWLDWGKVYSVAFLLLSIAVVFGVSKLKYIGKNNNGGFKSHGKYICCIPVIILLIFLCTASISRAAFIAQRAWVGGKNLLLCRNYSNVYKVVMNNIGQDQSLEKENEIREFAEKAYKELTQENGGFFMDSNDVACNDLMGLDSEQDGLIHERCNTHITVSPNFYKINPIQALDGEPVESKIDYDENTINLAVPEKYMHLRDQFVEQFTEYLDFNRFLIGERVYSAASNETWNPKKGPLSVNIIPVKNGQSYYTFDDSVRRNENNSIADAVAVIYTDNFHPSYILFTSSRALFFQYDEERPVDDYLNEIAGIKGFIRADSVFKTAKKDFELDLLDLAVALLMLGINIWGYLEVSQLISEKKRNVLFQLIPAASGLGICYLLSGFRVMRIMRFDVIKGAIMLLILEVTIYFIWGRKKGDIQK